MNACGSDGPVTPVIFEVAYELVYNIRYCATECLRGAMKWTSDIRRWIPQNISARH